MREREEEEEEEGRRKVTGRGDKLGMAPRNERRQERVKRCITEEWRGGEEVKAG